MISNYIASSLAKTKKDTGEKVVPWETLWLVFSTTTVDECTPHIPMCHKLKQEVVLTQPIGHRALTSEAVGDNNVEHIGPGLPSSEHRLLTYILPFTKMKGTFRDFLFNMSLLNGRQISPFKNAPGSPNWVQMYEIPNATSPIAFGEAIANMHSL